MYVILYYIERARICQAGKRFFRLRENRKTLAVTTNSEGKKRFVTNDRLIRRTKRDMCPQTRRILLAKSGGIGKTIVITFYATITRKRGQYYFVTSVKIYKNQRVIFAVFFCENPLKTGDIFVILYDKYLFVRGKHSHKQKSERTYHETTWF